MLKRENVQIIGEKERFADRQTAGQLLVPYVQQKLAEYETLPDEVVVLGLPRGGMAVAAPIAEALGHQLDFVVTRKLHAPHQRNLVIGALTERGRAFLNKPVIDALSISDMFVQEEIAREQMALNSSVAAYRRIVPASDLAGKTVVVADDNVITGSTMFATLRGLWAERPQRIILALPVAPRDTLMALGDFADFIIALRAPMGTFSSMRDYFEAYEELTEEDVQAMLQEVMVLAV
jgi:putative phosphoribosyl transferase